MKEFVGVLLLICLLILPAALVVGFSFTGTAHPIEKSVIKNDGFLNESPNDIEILFFGFAGCATVCPASLGKIATVLDSEKLTGTQASAGGLFIEIKSTAEDSQNSTYADQYSRTFSSKIRGYTPDMRSYQQLAGEFVIRLHENRGDAGQISHTDHFFILVRNQNEWSINRVLRNTIDESQMIDIVTHTINNL